jgi:hypothetical protein
MTDQKNQPADFRQAGSFLIEGQIRREQTESQPGELKLAAYVFDKAGTLLGSAELDDAGKYSVPVRLARPADVELVVGPAGQAQQIRQSSAYSEQFSAADWKGDGRQFRLHHDALLPLDVWLPWWRHRYLPGPVCEG